MRFLWEMNKPGKKKLKKELEKAVKKAKEQDPPAPEEDKAFDFGGLPNRDLKKNLGCG
ncbi:MAG TPA: hypothetical protein VF141_00340 [Chryseolinea sp.]